MDYINGGMRMDIRVKRGPTRMGKKMDYGPNGMIMDRKVLKGLTRMG